MQPLRNGLRTFIAGILMSCSTGSLFAQAPAAPGMTPPFAPPPIQPTLLDFVTGLPLAYNAKVMATNPLLRPPFANQPLNSPKGLASSIKANQLDAKNRIKAAKFLGQQDCVKEEGATPALLALLTKDPVERVRYEAALALKNQLSRGPGTRMSRKEKQRYEACRGCCNEKVLNELSKVAYGVDDFNCPVEPSKRVRKAAIAAMACCGDCAPVAAPAGYNAPLQPMPAEGLPGVDPGPAGINETELPVPQAPPVDDHAVPEPEASRSAPSGQPLPAITRKSLGSQLHPDSGFARFPNFGSLFSDEVVPPAPKAVAEPKVSLLNPTFGGGLSPAQATPVSAAEITAGGQPKTDPIVISQAVDESGTDRLEDLDESSTATVIWISAKNETVRLGYNNSVVPEVGSRAKVYHWSDDGSKCVGEVEIIRCQKQSALARPVGALKLSDIKIGDEAFLPESAASQSN